MPDKITAKDYLTSLFPGWGPPPWPEHVEHYGDMRADEAKAELQGLTIQLLDSDCSTCQHKNCQVCSACGQRCDFKARIKAEAKAELLEELRAKDVEGWLLETPAIHGCEHYENQHRWLCGMCIRKALVMARLQGHDEGYKREAGELLHITDKDKRLAALRIDIEYSIQDLEDVHVGRAMHRLRNALEQEFTMMENRRFYESTIEFRTLNDTIIPAKVYTYETLGAVYDVIVFEGGAKTYRTNSGPASIRVEAKKDMHYEIEKHFAI